MSGSGDAYLHEVADGVHAWIQPDGGWCLNNAGIVRGDEELIVVDTAATQRRALALHAAATSVGPLPVRTVVNTHHHGDHVFGNAVFPGATVVAHRDSRSEMIRSGTAMKDLWPDVEWGSLPLVPPHLTFDDRLTLHAGATTVELRHVGPAHTVGDVVAWLPEQRVLFAGDVLMSGATPFVLMGSAAGLRGAVATLRGLEPRVIVCGHGPVCGTEVFDDTDAYLDVLLDLAAGGVERGQEPLEVAQQADLGRFAELGEPERLAANLHRAMAELTGTARGARIPSAAAFRDMIALGGDGAGLPCAA